MSPFPECISSFGVHSMSQHFYTSIEEGSNKEEDEEEEEPSEAAPADSLQMPPGLVMLLGMASVVLTVAAGLETPDFLELWKTTTTLV
jgi:splicing factor 3B subunit 2